LVVAVVEPIRTAGGERMKNSTIAGGRLRLAGDWARRIKGEVNLE
jgi:hypothetical protein